MAMICCTYCIGFTFCSKCNDSGFICDRCDRGSDRCKCKVDDDPLIRSVNDVLSELTARVEQLEHENAQLREMLSYYYYE